MSAVLRPFIPTSQPVEIKKKNTYEKGERHVFLILAIRLKELNEIAVLLPFTNFRVIR